MKRNKEIVILGDTSRYLRLSDIDMNYWMNAIECQQKYYIKNFYKEESITFYDILYPCAQECFEHDILAHLKHETKEELSEYISVLNRYIMVCNKNNLLISRPIIDEDMNEDRMKLLYRIRNA